MQQFRFSPVVLFVALALAFAPGAVRADAICRLCGAGSTSVGAAGSEQRRDVMPLRIEISTHLDFARLALRDRMGGQVDVDPASGGRTIRGSLTPIGGSVLRGEVRLTGEPGRSVRIDMPHRITLSSSDGSLVELQQLDTDLPAQPRLDMDGKLSFTFGGRLDVDGRASGNYRGRIPITAEYE